MNRQVNKLMKAAETAKTIDGNIVFPGAVLFYMKDTLGLPLDVQLDQLAEVNMVPNWKEFVKAAMKAGWKKEKIYNECVYAVQDSFIFPREKHEEFKTLICYLIAIEGEQKNERA